MPEPAKLTLRVLSGLRTVGAAWHYKSDRFITCAHVVNAALGRPENRKDAPGPGDLVTVKGPFGEVACMVDASVWRPLVLYEDGGFDGDVAHLIPQKKKMPAPAEHDTLKPSDDRFWKARGYTGFTIIPQGYGAEGKLGQFVERRRELLTSSGEALAPVQGFSGAPVMVGDDVVGIVASVLLTPSKSPPSNESDAARLLREELERWREQAGEPHLSYMIEVQDLLESIPHQPPLASHTPDFPYLRIYQRKALKERDKRTESEVGVAGELEPKGFKLRARMMNDPNTIPDLHRSTPGEFYEDSVDLTALELLNRARAEISPIVLSAPGGSGKTHFLLDVTRFAIAEELLPFLIDIRSLGATNATPTQEDILRAGIGAVGDQPYKDAIAKAPDKVVLIVDGLNERSSNRHAIVTTLTGMAREALIIGDRLVRSGLSDCRWATIAPLNGAQIKAALNKPVTGTMEKLLASPFFLQLAVDVQRTADMVELTRDVLFQRYFSEIVFAGGGGSVAEIAEPSFRLYEAQKSPRAPYAAWIEAGFKPEAVRQLCDALALSVLDDHGLAVDVKDVQRASLEFTHQLFHDWCAASYVSKLKDEQWTNDIFDRLTLWRASADAFDLAVVQLIPARTTSFLRKAYDWDWAFVIEGILNVEERGNTPLRPAFRDAVFALNALRLFDVFQHTRAVMQRLVMQYAELEGALNLNQPNRAAIIDAYEERYRGQDLEDLEDWRREFVKRDKAGHQELAKFSADPLTSWTAVNIARVNGLSDGFVQAAIVAFQFSRAVKPAPGPATQLSVGTRWRIVHALGAAKPEHEVATFLSDVVSDEEENDNVRFGAARSLLELAAEADEAMRGQILSGIADKIGNVKSARIRSEFRRAAILAEKAPAGWYQGIKQVLVAGEAAARAHNDSDADVWGEQIAVVSGKIGAQRSE